MADRELDVPVYGTWSTAVAPDDPGYEQWDTPGRVPVRAGAAYEFTIGAVADVTDDDVGRLARAAAGADGLRAVRLQGCRNLTDRGLRHLASLPGLETVMLGGAGVTDRGVSELAAVAGLRVLDLEMCEGVTDRGAAAVGRLTGLRDLTLSGCRVTDAGVAHLAGLTELTGLGLDGCPALTDRSVAVIAGLPKLTRVGLNGSWQVTDRGLALLGGMPRLEYVGLCDSGSFLSRLAGRLLRLAGGPPAGTTPRGLFSPAGVRRLQEAHPGCDIFQPARYQFG